LIHSLGAVRSHLHSRPLRFAADQAHSKLMKIKSSIAVVGAVAVLLIYNALTGRRRA